MIVKTHTAIMQLGNQIPKAIGYTWEGEGCPEPITLYDVLGRRIFFPPELCTSWKVEI